ncbi:MAG: hypothetical protein ABIF88_01770 [archaeon]
MAKQKIAYAYARKNGERNHGDKSRLQELVGPLAIVSEDDGKFYIAFSTTPDHKSQDFQNLLETPNKKRGFFQELWDKYVHRNSYSRGNFTLTSYEEESLDYEVPIIELKPMKVA